MSVSFQVVAGKPDERQLAAIVVALAAARSRATPPAETPAPRRAWNDPGRRLGVARSWRDTTLPR